MCPSREYEPVSFHENVSAAGESRGNAQWPVILRILAVCGGTAMMIFFVPNSIGAKVAGAEQGLAGDSEDRLIPFLPGLTKAAELAMRDNIYSLNVDEVRRVAWVPYHVVRDICRSERFRLSEPSEDRIMYEISVGNCGSTWQLLMIGTAIRRKHWRLPIVHIELAIIENWQGVDKIPLNENPKGSWGEGEFFGKLFKIQHMQEQLYNESAIIFNAFKLSENHPNMSTFAKGACPCCFVMKELLGDREAETAMVYMHALALGLDLTEDDLYQIRLNLATWIKGKYCYPGSIHTTACEAVKEFPELLEGDLPFLEYSDLEDE